MLRSLLQGRNRQCITLDLHKEEGRDLVSLAAAYSLLLVLYAWQPLTRALCRLGGSRRRWMSWWRTSDLA